MNSVTKVYEAARDGSPDLKDLLKRLKTDERETALETKTEDGGHNVTPLIIAAFNGHLDSVKILLKYKADIEAQGTLTDEDKVIVDVFSFGVLLCEICIGKLPDPERRKEQVAMVTNRAIRALIRRCLQQNPTARPSMEDIIRELEKLA